MKVFHKISSFFLKDGFPYFVGFLQIFKYIHPLFLFQIFPSCYVRDDWVEYQTYCLSRIPCFQTLHSASPFFQLCLFWASKVWWRVGTSKIMRPLLRNSVLHRPLGFPPWPWRLCCWLCSRCSSLLCTLGKDSQSGF